MQSREEGVSDGQSEDPPFRHHAVDVVVLNQHDLLEHLQRKDFSRPSILGEHHLPEAALAQHLEHLEIGQRRLAAIGNFLEASARS